MSKEHPILFSGPMVRAILNGTKTQTRRIVKKNPPFVNAHGAVEWYPGGRKEGFHYQGPTGFAIDVPGGWAYHWCPYGMPGDRLYVREKIAVMDRLGFADQKRDSIRYAADQDTSANLKFRPSIHMPRWASRITLEVVNVRVDRLKDIREEDALAEGIERGDDSWDTSGLMAYHHDKNGFYLPGSHVRYNAPSHAFRALWESINGPGSWDANPWVWVVEFKRITQ